MHSGTGWSPVPQRSAYVEPKEGVAQNVQHPLFYPVIQSHNILAAPVCLYRPRPAVPSAVLH